MLPKSFIRVVDNKEYHLPSTYQSKPKRRLQTDSDAVSRYMSTKYLFYESKITGSGIKVGVFDSGVADGICNNQRTINFSDEPETDLNGHGSFVSSVLRIT